MVTEPSTAVLEISGSVAILKLVFSLGLQRALWTRRGGRIIKYPGLATNEPCLN